MIEYISLLPPLVLGFLGIAFGGLAAGVGTYLAARNQSGTARYLAKPRPPAEGTTRGQHDLNYAQALGMNPWELYGPGVGPSAQAQGSQLQASGRMHAQAAQTKAQAFQQATSLGIAQLQASAQVKSAEIAADAQKSAAKTSADPRWAEFLSTKLGVTDPVLQSRLLDVVQSGRPANEIVAEFTEILSRANANQAELGSQLKALRSLTENEWIQIAGVYLGYEGAKAVFRLLRRGAPATIKVGKKVLTKTGGSGLSFSTLSSRFRGRGGAVGVALGSAGQVARGLQKRAAKSARMGKANQGRPGTPSAHNYPHPSQLPKETQRKLRKMYEESNFKGSFFEWYIHYGRTVGFPSKWIRGQNLP